MKMNVMTLLLAMVISTAAWAQESADEQAVKEAIAHFTQSADRQDADALDEILDANFRVVMNRLFGSNEVSVLTKEAYLDKIRNKEFGGEKRKVRIENVTIIGHAASAKVTLRGSNVSFTSLLQFVKTKDARWKLVSDLPTVI